MKVILRKDVRGVGQKDTIVELSDGYALNFLIPNGLAEQGTDKRIRELRAKEDASSRAKQATDSENEALARKLEGLNIVVGVKTNELGHLYQALSGDMIATAIRKQLGIDIPPNAVILNAPIRKVGESDTMIQIGSIRAKMRVSVIKAAE
ncbi:MAG TPA: 50S ribosomal protein L9 [Candidatus Paceibacterota bacterium]